MQPSLNYHRDAVNRLKKARWPLGIILLLVAAALTWRLAPAVSNRIIVLQLQRKCLADQPRPEQAVFDTRPDSLPQWNRSDRNFTSGTIGETHYVAWLPACWNDFLSRSGFAPDGSVALIALHRLKSQAGDEYLVAMQAFHVRYATEQSLIVVPRIFKMGSSLRSPAEVTQRSELKLTFFPLARPMAIYSDPPEKANQDFLSYRVADSTGTRKFLLTLSAGNVFNLGEVTPPAPPSPASFRSSVPPASPEPLPVAR